MSGFFSKERIIAAPGFNRWLVPPASIGIHLCIGSVYAWSIYNPALIRTVGVVASSSEDWGLSQVVWVFTVAIVALGLAAAFAGRWLEKVGPRTVGLVAACCWGGGYIIGGIGILTHQISLLYLGYGVIGGCGLGLGYVSPVSTLIRWFPDRRGMATGMAIMGFGGGAMIAAPAKEWLIQKFYQAPEYLGAADAVELITREGRRFVEISGSLREAVVIGANEVSRMIVPGPEGVYLAGTGSTGVAETFFILGVVYFLVMVVAALSYRIPAEGWKPEGWTPPPQDESHAKMITTRHVDIDQALKTPQFYQLWIMLCFNVTAGIGVLGVAKTMMGDIFGSALPHIVDGAFAATYVLMISVFNMIGRFFWASASDYIGRRNTYSIFFILGAILYCSIPITAHQLSVNPVVLWLVAFYAVTMVIFTMYGGGFATIPAYLADIFGTRFVGGIHGRLLTAWSTAGLLGPMAITWLRERSVQSAIADLATKVDPGAFRDAFGADISKMAELVREKTVTIPRLMEIVPPGTVDPTIGLYNSTMFLMAGLLLIALLCNLLMRPVAEHHYMDSTSQTK
ncbi:MAG: OFA family MFS transporter [Candidatus Porifericomitaceae bacterium WSBS_2022_MAG_OTU9]